MPSLVIDLNENKFPIGIDVLDASKLFNTEKNLLKNIEDGEIVIKISKDEIELKISLIIPLDQKTISVPVSFVGENKSQIPSIQTEIAVALS